MDREKVEQLLTQPQGPTLDFKQDWYHLNHSDPNVRKYQRDELIKDIIALANGSATTAGETAYLIIGATDAIGSDGRRNLYDMSAPLPSRRDLLEKINSACAPAIEDLHCDTVEVAGRRLFVVTIPPSPYLHETTRDLHPDGKHYQKHVVFIREHERIEIANDRERNTIRKMKELYSEHTMQAPPRRFGAAIGAIVGGLIWSAVAKPIVTGAGGLAKYINGLPGTVIGGAIGFMLGDTYRGLKYARYELPKIPTPWRYLFAPITLLIAYVTRIMWDRIARWLLSKIRT
jgi:hypothetical protein